MVSKKIDPPFLSSSLPVIVFSLLSIIISGLFLFSQIDKVKQTDQSESTKILAETSASLIESQISEKPLTDKLKTVILAFAASADIRIRLVSFSGRLLFDSYNEISESDISYDSLNNEESDLFFSREIRSASLKGSGIIVTKNDNNDDTFRYAKKLDNYFLHLTGRGSFLSETSGNTANSVLLTGVFLFLFLCIINVVFASRIDSPVMATIRFAESVANMDFSKRITHYSTTAIGALQRSLNRLSDSLEGHIHELTLEKNKLNLVIENINDSICMINADNRIIVTNYSFRKLFNIPDVTPLRSYYELIRSSDLNSRIDNALNKFEKMHFEQQLQDGTCCEIDINPIYRDRFFFGLLIIMHDVTAKKQIDNMKTELVGNLSHELKTPIAILKGYLETIELYIDDKKLVKDLSQKCLVNLERQTYIINDMLSLNRLETDNTFETEMISIVQILENCVNVLAPRILQKKIALTQNHRDSDLSVKGNKFLAEQIFFNIITNAINYNVDSGSIIIESFCENDMKRHKTFFSIIIKDTGIGIPKDSISRIFERFYRVDKGRSRSTGGTGLGLSIVKHSAELLGWEISVISEGEGSCFTVRIPV